MFTSSHQATHIFHFPACTHLHCCHAQDLEADGYRVHPALLDAATHFGAVFDTDAGEAPRVPVRMAGFHIPAATQQAWQLTAQLPVSSPLVPVAIKSMSRSTGDHTLGMQWAASLCGEGARVTSFAVASSPGIPVPGCMS